jgi:hypothetical protein
VSGHECEKMLHLVKSTCRRVSVEKKRSLERPRCAEQAGEDGMSIASRQAVEVVEAGTLFRNRSCPQSVRARVRKIASPHKVDLPKGQRRNQTIIRKASVC